MKLNRRNVLAGLGTAAAGTAAIFGTGAVVNNQVDRAFTVSVSDDDGEEVQLPIEPNNDLDTSGRVETVDDDGVEVFEVDATNLPRDAYVTIGEFNDNEDSSSLETEAFSITNQNAFDKDIELTISLEDSEANSTIDLALEDGQTISEGEEEVINLEIDEAVGLGVWIDTVEDDDDDLTVDITLEAEVNE